MFSMNLSYITSNVDASQIKESQVWTRKIPQVCDIPSFDNDDGLQQPVIK